MLIDGASLEHRILLFFGFDRLNFSSAFSDYKTTSEEEFEMHSVINTSLRTASLESSEPSRSSAEVQFILPVSLWIFFVSSLLVWQFIGSMNAFRCYSLQFPGTEFD